MNGLANFNIIGNGFDLYHGMPTSYYYFACYLLAKNEDIYDDWAEMYGFSRGIIHRPFEDLERKIDDKGYWSNFEKSLGYISSEWVENSLLDDLDLENPEAVDLPIERPNHVAEIKQMLNDWIRETVDTDHNFEVVNQLIGAKKLDISASDAFLSFNYTHTLEKLYHAHNVLHIHGENTLDSEDCELVIGHGNDSEIKKMQETIEDLEQYYYEQPSRNRIQEYQFEIDILEDLRKPVETCLKRLKAFLAKLPEPEAIYVYGFSLGDVDVPYIKFIRAKWPNCRWKFSYYSDSDKITIDKTAEFLGLKESQYELFELKNETSNEIEKRIVKENHIQTFPVL